MNKLQFRKNKVRNNGFRWNKAQIKKTTEEIVEEEDDQLELYNELMDELKSIKRKKTLERFIKDNRGLINELELENKNKLLGYIRNNFY